MGEFIPYDTEVLKNALDLLIKNESVIDGEWGMCNVHANGYPWPPQIEALAEALGLNLVEYAKTVVDR